jgi:hypothetical protein
MLALPDPYLNGIRLTHAELRALHQNMRIAIHASTAKYCLDGPRLLRPDAGERYELRAHKRDRKGCLLASVTVLIPEAGASYVRRVRLVQWDQCDATLKVEVAREQRGTHTETRNGGR